MHIINPNKITKRSAVEAFIIDEVNIRVLALILSIQGLTYI